MNDTEKKTTTEGAERPAGAAEAVTHEPAQEAAEKPAEGNTGVYTHVFKKPFEYEGKTYTELTFNFERLSGRDMVSIETEMPVSYTHLQLPNGATYIGTYHKLGLDFYQYNEWYLDDWTEPGEPENKPIVPDKHIALLYKEADYSIYYLSLIHI